MHYPLDSPESEREAVSASPVSSYRPLALNVSTAISEPSRAIPEQAYRSVWPVEAVLGLESAWFCETGRVPVGYILPVIKQEIKACVTNQYKILERSLERNGQAVPVRISYDAKRLRDGIHRVAIMHYLLFDEIKVSTSSAAWDEWDRSDTGQEYLRLWRERLGYRNVP